MNKKTYMLLGSICILSMILAWALQDMRTENDTDHIEVTYQCDNNKLITALYSEGPILPAPEPGEPPLPTGSVGISLNGGPVVTLQQTISGSGVRYANTDESFVFWNKGNEALIMRNNTMDLEYTNCLEA